MRKVKGKGFNQKQIAKFDWQVFPRAEKFLQREVNNFLKHNKVARKLAKDMQAKTNTRFFDWIDHIAIPKKRITEEKLKKFGFTRLKCVSPPKTKVYKNTKSVFPPVMLHDQEGTEIAIKPEDLDQFMNKRKGKIQGKKYAPVRRAVLSVEGTYSFSAIERRGSLDFWDFPATDIIAYKKALQKCLKRKRVFRSDRQGMVATQKLVKSLLRSLSKARAADAFFRAERVYWEKRNKIGQKQKARQDTLGLGWGNHDHHTYRSSRENFSELITIFELLGFKCRERFFAGEKAGWGAQIVEHSSCDIVVFADVDLDLREKDKDFAHKGLRHRKELGTVGLWIALHGESMLQAGMHHLEARFEFNQLKKQLNFMNPFSYFPFLKQAFSLGERWRVNKQRVEKLVKAGSISSLQGKEFIKNGALGSHLENLQRRQGFKGFNQQSVSVIIKATDPRKQKREHHKGA